MDSSNQFEVVVSQPGRWSTPRIAILRGLPADLSQDEAANLGLWLVALSGLEPVKVAKLLDEITRKVTQ